MPEDVSSIAAPSERRFLVGSWTVIPGANEIVRGDVVERLEPKAMQVLLYLAARAGRAVSRNELLDAVWADVYVTEGTLSRCISQVRKAFDDDPRAPHVIETIPKTGYRLIAPVRYPSGGDSLAGREAAPPLPTVRPSFPPSFVEPRSEAAPRFLSLLALLVVLVIGAALVGPLHPDAPPPATRPLTTMPGVEHAATLSPDGRHLAFIGQDDASRRPALFVLPAGAETPLRVSADDVDASYAAWSRAGRRLASFRCTSWEACALYTTSPHGRDARRLVGDVRRPWGLAWAPDGATLAFSAVDSLTQTWRLFLLDLTTLQRRPLTTPPETIRGDLEPAFSPDGRTIAFKRSTSEGVGDLYRIAVDGTRLERLTRDAASLAGQTWMPDGKSLVFASNRAGLFQLWRIAAEGGTPERLSNVPARDPAFPHVAPDGSRLIFEEWTLEVNLWQASTGSPDAPPHRTIASTWLDEQPALSPDPDEIAFISTRSGAPELWRARSDGSEATRLTTFNGSAVGSPAWSPDGRWIAFEAFEDNQAELYILNAEGGRPRRLTMHEAADRSPKWSRDGRRLYFGSDRTGAWQIWEVPVEGGPAVQVTQEGGRVAMEGPDGQTLYIARFGEPGLWVVPRAGGTPRRITERLASMDWGNWAVIDAGLYFVDRADGPARLMHLDLDTGAVTPLARTLNQLVAAKPALTLSQDGQMVLYARIERSESDLVEVTPLP